MLLRFPLGARVQFRWVSKGPIEGLIAARVEFHRQPGSDERITLDSFELTARPDDFDGDAYKLRGVPPPGLHAGVYRPTAAYVRVREHASEVAVDLWEYGQEFALELFDDSILNAPA